ncbi:restriction endonuclease subunit S [Vibrio toranzoniae]|uniref:restriction endonuclease subunit S n=1 Tax=Vibrio toranzoniae TaxID=1194427 RepID=UPI001377FFD0|nr:restriction endonuclease subunit S [Vibrio toranzoniae]NAZ47787.1 restriction endonuclease subunit S [Vibrio toranzoniae]
MGSNFFSTTIGEQLTLQRGFDITKKEQKEGNVPVVSSGGISSYHNVSKVVAPGVVLGRKGTLGTVFLLDKDFWPHDTSLWVKDFKGNNPHFVYYFFKSMSAELKKMDVGAANPALNRNHVHPLQVEWPSREVQDKIASIGAALDQKITLNNQINQTLEQMAQTLFKSWFVDFDPVKAKMNGEHPKGMDAATVSLFPEKLIESEVGLIPEGWKVKKIGDVVERYSVGKKYSQKTAVESGLVPILDQGKSGIIGYHNDKPGVKASLDNPIIVFANHTCYMKLVTYDFSAIQNVLPFKLNGCDIYWSYLATQGKQNFIEYKGHWPDFMIHEIVIPSEELMQRFGELVKPFYSQMASNENQNKSLAKLRDTLLPKLLSGEIDLESVQVEQAKALAE